MKYIDEPWHIILTEENRNAVEKWRGLNGLDLKSPVGMVKWSNEEKMRKGHNGPNGTIVGLTYNHGIEISYSEFKEHILKQKINYEIY
jgi:hypothetical protein